jgi:hypothetical protein
MYCPTETYARPTGYEAAEFTGPPAFAPTADPSPGTPEVGDEDDDDAAVALESTDPEMSSVDTDNPVVIDASVAIEAGGAGPQASDGARQGTH